MAFTLDQLSPRYRRLLRLDPDTGCWLFIGKWTTGNGYAKTRAPSTTKTEKQHRVLHRVVWEELKGPLCPTILLDHLVCKRRLCSCPDHLDPVFNVVNTRRGDAVLYRRKEEYATSDQSS